MFFVCSCATMFNSPTVNVKIYADTDSVSVNLNNAPFWHDLPASFDLYRSKYSLKITAQKDTIQKNIEINRIISTTFWLGNYFCFFGYLVDMTNPKRFTYPKTVLINFDDKSNPYNTWLPPKQNLIDIKVAMHGGGQNVNGNNFGLWGISAGFQHYFSEKNSLIMNFGLLNNFPNADFIGKYISSSASYENIQIGSFYKQLQYNTGLHFKQTKLAERETLQLYPEYVDILLDSKTQNHIGFALSTNYRASKYIELGLNYYPSFLVLEKNPKFRYSHLLFFELSFIFEAYRPL